MQLVSEQKRTEKATITIIRIRIIRQRKRTQTSEPKKAATAV